MKKVLSVILAILMLVTLIPMFAFSVSALDAGDTSTAPATLPDGNAVSRIVPFADWDWAGSESKGNADVENGFYTIKTSDAQAWTSQWVNSTAWRGASGFMFYVDASVVENEQVGFLFKVLATAVRPRDGVGNKGCVQLWSSAKCNGKDSGKTTHTYRYHDGSWQDISTNAYHLEAGTNASGWYYLPFTSILNMGGSATVYDKDPTVWMNLQEFMESFENQQIGKICIQSKHVGLKFGDVHFVYSTPGVPADADAKTTPLFGNMALNGNPEGNAVGAVNGNAVTVSKMTENSAEASANRVWLTGLAQQNLAGASGLRFHVDTTKLDDGAKLQLRLRLRSSSPASNVTDIWSTDTLGYKEIQSNSNMQYVCRSNGSVAYYFDADGNAKAIYPAANVSSAKEADLFEALPEDYKGDIYIPFDSFWLSVLGSYTSLNCAKPFSATAAIYGIDMLTICHAISGTTQNDEVTYSDFRLVYEAPEIDHASVTLTNAMDVNFYAPAIGGTSEMILKVGETTQTVKAEDMKNGTFRFTYANLLPHQMTDTITGTYKVQVGEASFTKDFEYSVQKYCENLLKDSKDEALNKLLVDMLYYGEAAQKQMQYNLTSLATANLTDEQKALHTTTLPETIPDTIKYEGTEDANNSIVDAVALENGRIGLTFTVKAAAAETVLVGTIGGRTTEVALKPVEGQANTYTVVFENIGADELSATVVLTLKNGEAQVGQTLTFTPDAYILRILGTSGATGDLADFLKTQYIYGCSAAGYANR